VTVPAVPVSVKVVAFMVEAFIASLNVAVIDALGQAPSAGVTETTVGAPIPLQVATPVVNAHTSLPARALPNMSLTPVVIVAV
jgi:hypothetical protein